MKDCIKIVFASVVVMATAGCVDLNEESSDDSAATFIGLDEVAEILAMIPIDHGHLEEVHQAVASSSDNGYDEEYTMKNLFACPGAGVGDSPTKVTNEFAQPLRDLIEDYVYSSHQTKSSLQKMAPEVFLDELMESDIQIYWPFSGEWDGTTPPVVTFDPEDGSEVNIGYRLVMGEDGYRHLEEVEVDEDMAAEVPVWVVNRNSDAGFKTLEMLRREDPQGGEGGGTIIVSPSMLPSTKTDSVSPLRSLILKDFTMNRHYDSWFAGASEFFVKTGFVEDFTASTEAELRLFNPLVTDFMIVVKRSQVGKPQPFNAVLVTEWPEQMTHCAFMITEDDGGTRTEWKCTALVRIASKSYGLEINLPFNSRDDVVWRGQLSSRWIDANSNIVGHFGDVDLTFEVVEY